MSKILPRNNSAAWGQVYKRSSDEVSVGVTVNDRKIREEVGGFNGLERAFALVPTRKADGTIEWKRHELSYTGTGGDRDGSVKDYHSVIVHDHNVNMDDLQRYGVAFGLDTNQGTIWLQYSDDNYRLGSA